MALQKVFLPDYIQYLKNNISVEDYMKDSFPYDETKVRQLNRVIHSDDLLEKLDPKPEGDYSSAIAIYEAFSDISPVFAQQDDLWIYLTHVDLFTYVKNRWPMNDDWDETKKIKHIENHWHRNQERFIRTTFAGFWWNVYMTIDDTRTDKYELTKILFSNAELRTSSFGELQLIRHREAMIGILEYIKENFDIFEVGFNAKARYIRHLFDIIGGYKNLSMMDRSFFKSTLEKYKDSFATLTDTTSAKVGSDVFIKI